MCKRVPRRAAWALRTPAAPKRPACNCITSAQMCWRLGLDLTRAPGSLRECRCNSTCCIAVVECALCGWLAMSPTCCFTACGVLQRVRRRYNIMVRACTACSGRAPYATRRRAIARTASARGSFARSRRARGRSHEHQYPHAYGARHDHERRWCDFCSICRMHKEVCINNIRSHARSARAPPLALGCMHEPNALDASSDFRPRRSSAAASGERASLSNRPIDSRSRARVLR